MRLCAKKTTLKKLCDAMSAFVASEKVQIIAQ
jgi:hypothetical protein